MDHSIVILVHEKSAMVEDKHSLFDVLLTKIERVIYECQYHLSIFGNSSVEELMWFIGLQSTLQLQRLSQEREPKLTWGQGGFLWHVRFPLQIEVDTSHNHNGCDPHCKARTINKH